MTTATVIRPLAPSEQIFAHGEVFVGYSARLTGRLDLVALTTAFEAVLHARPILTAVLDPGDGYGHTLLAAEAAEPPMTVVDGDPEQLLTGVDLDQRRALCTLSVVRGTNSTAVTLFTHHSIADATHSLALFYDIWSCYRIACTGGTPRLPDRGYPAPVEDLLTARGVTQFSADEVDSSLASGPAIPSAHADPYPTLVTSRCLLTEERTAALVDLGHRERVTVHALVSAALLLTEAEARQTPVTELVCSYSVDLRSRVSPSIGTTEGTNVLGFADYLPAGTSPTLTALARGVGTALHADLASGYIQQTPLQLPEMAAEPPPSNIGTVIATNWGRIPPPPTPPELGIGDFRTTMISKVDRTGRRPVEPGGGTTIVSTYKGRLSIEIHHPPEFTTVQQPRIAQLTDLLRG